MEQKKLSKWLKGILIGTAACGLAVYLALLPDYGRSLAQAYPEFAGRFWPWLIFLWATGVPCYLALGLGWRIAGRIGEDRSFSEGNARDLSRIAWLAAGDAGAFFLGNAILLLADMSHPGVVLMSLIVVFVGVAIAVAAAALSHLVHKAAALQEQADLTI
ncbi:MAG: DUF2975 domain-containing protein [Clostridia bacterium]|nr:DUF2975 domain-containing protein [Clostridia bacterium]